MKKIEPLELRIINPHQRDLVNSLPFDQIQAKINEIIEAINATCDTDSYIPKLEVGSGVVQEISMPRKFKKKGKNK